MLKTYNRKRIKSHIPYFAWKCTLLILFPILFTACMANPDTNTQSAPEQPLVEVHEVSQNEWTDSIQLTGMVMSAGQSQVFAAFGGEVSEVLVQNGDYVQAGDVLVRFDATDAELGVQQAQAGMDAAKLQVEAAKAMRDQAIQQAKQHVEQSNQALQMIEQARAEIEQSDIEDTSVTNVDFNPLDEPAQQESDENDPNTMPGEADGIDPTNQADKDGPDLSLDSNFGFLERLFNSDFPPFTFPDLGSLNEFDLEEELTRARGAVQAAELALEQAKRTDSIEAAEAQVTQAEIGLQMAQRQAEQAVITAPISGEVVNVIAQAGSPASPQMPLMSIVQTDELLVRTDASERQIIHIQDDQAVRIRIPALDVELDGYVTYVSPVPGPESRKYPIELAFTNDVDQARVGMLVQVLVDSVPVQGIEVPINALMEDDQDQSYVFIIRNNEAESDQDGEQVVVRKEVTVLQETSKFALTEGLQSGDQVVVRGQSSLEDGDLVTFRKTSQEAKE